MTRTVLATFTNSAPVKVYEVEYRDSEGEWLPAVGKWAGEMVSVQSQYSSEAGARLAARELNKVCGWHTRVLYAEVSGA